MGPTSLVLGASPPRRSGVTHLQFSQLLDGFFPPLDGRVGLQFQVLQIPFQLLLGRHRQGTLLSLVFQFRLVFVELGEARNVYCGAGPPLGSLPPGPRFAPPPKVGFPSAGRR